MNQLNKLTLFLLLITSFSLFGCRFGYTDNNQNVSENGDSSALVVAKTSLKYIQENKRDSLKALLNKKVLRMVKPEQLDWLMQNGQKVLNDYIFPNDTSIIKSQSINYSVTGKKVIDMFSFPFQHKVYKDTIKYFHITVVDNEIYKLFLNKYPPGIHFIEPKHNEPHIEKLNLQTDNIRWFRIWYDDGYKINKKYGNHTGYYAVSGNKEKLNKIGIKKQFQEVFNLINAASFDSLDYKYMREREVGDPEWIYLRMKFSNEEYKNLGEFEISFFIDEQPGKKEIMSDYIIFKHTDKTRYLLLKNKNPELVKKLKEIAHHNYGNYYERNP